MKKFPYDEPRKVSSTSDQLDLVAEAVDALYRRDYDNVIIDAPTGVGKSAVNTTVTDMIEGDSFYITPQKALREQLQKDEVLGKYYKALRGRVDYECKETGTNCSDCTINQSQNVSCMEQEHCTYWNEKVEAMMDDVAVLTFAYLIVDKSIPVWTEDGRKVSFGDRDLLIVDECHNLENQAASLFAGFKVSPWNLPADEVFKNVTANLDIEHTKRHHQVEAELETIERRANNYVSNKRSLNRELDEEESKKVKQCDRFLDRLKYFREEIENGRDWVVDMDMTEYHGRRYKTFKLKPVKVDRFLRNFVWERGEKRILSTATMPYRGNPAKWQKQIGLPGKTHIIRTDMPFPKGYRPIHTDTIIDSMSNNGVQDNWGEIMDTIAELAKKHSGENGVIHSASYPRSERFWKDAQDYEPLQDSVVFDKPEANTDYLMTEWLEGEEDIFVSPAVTEGVDLQDEDCRWQVLLKAPFPSYGDPRVEYLLDELYQWDWYYETTAISIIQSVGRAVRSKDDYADYYVLDEKFNDVVDRVQMPDWFLEAIDTDPTYEESEGALSW